MGRFKNNKRRWHAVEDALVRMTASMPVEQACAYLPGRTQAEIYARARRLGVTQGSGPTTLFRPSRHRPWSAREDETLRRACASGAARDILAALPERRTYEIASRLLVQSILASESDEAWRAANDALLGTWPSRIAKAAYHAARTIPSTQRPSPDTPDRRPGFTLTAGRAIPDVS